MILRVAVRLFVIVAAQSITPHRTERRILEQFHVRSRGMTDDELAVFMERYYDAHDATVKTARSRLSKAGLLVDSGERRPSNRGSQQIVWRLP